jgi:hypothetical protein
MIMIYDLYLLATDSAFTFLKLKLSVVLFRSYAIVVLDPVLPTSSSSVSFLVPFYSLGVLVLPSLVGSTKSLCSALFAIASTSTLEVDIYHELGDRLNFSANSALAFTFY